MPQGGFDNELLMITKRSLERANSCEAQPLTRQFLSAYLPVFPPCPPIPLGDFACSYCGSI